MDLSGLFVGDLTPEQRATLDAFAAAAERLAALIPYGTLTITYHQSDPTEVALDRRVRPDLRVKHST